MRFLRRVAWMISSRRTMLGGRLTEWLALAEPNEGDVVGYFSLVDGIDVAFALHAFALLQLAVRGLVKGMTLTLALATASAFARLCISSWMGVIEQVDGQYLHTARVSIPTSGQVNS
jgi:hypothetical protein